MSDAELIDIPQEAALPRSEEIEIALIRRDGGTQIRAAINQRKVNEYAEVLSGGGTLPPVDVFYDGTEYWLHDGFHRTQAHVWAGLKTIKAYIKPGTRRDAIFAATGANGTHGLERSDEDKRRAVWTLLSDEEWRQMADRRIAEHTHVSPTFVGKLRKEYEETVHGGQSDASAVRTDKLGRKIDTTNIGGKKADPPAAPKGSATSLPSSPTPPVDKIGVGDWVRAQSGHEGEVVSIDGRTYTVKTSNGERGYLPTQLTKVDRPTGPQLPPPAAAHADMRRTLESLYTLGGWVGSTMITLYEAPALEAAGLIACCKRRSPTGAPVRWFQITAQGAEILGRPALEFVPEPAADDYPDTQKPASAAPAPSPDAPAPQTTPSAPAPAAQPVSVTLALLPATPDQPRTASLVLRHGDKTAMRRIVFRDAQALGQGILDAEAETLSS